MSALLELTSTLNRALAQRQIEEGFRILEQRTGELAQFEPQQEASAHVVLCIAEWVDAGYSDHRLIESLLNKFSAEQRRRLSIAEYLLLRMAEAFSCIAKEDADSAISLSHFVIQAERELNDPRLMVLVHFW